MSRLTTSKTYSSQLNSTKYSLILQNWENNRGITCSNARLLAEWSTYFSSPTSKETKMPLR